MVPSTASMSWGRIRSAACSPMAGGTQVPAGPGSAPTSRVTLVISEVVHVVGDQLADGDATRGPGRQCSAVTDVGDEAGQA